MFRKDLLLGLENSRSKFQETNKVIYVISINKKCLGENSHIAVDIHVIHVQPSNSVSRSDYAPATVNAFYSPLQNQIRELFEARSIFLPSFWKIGR